MLKVVWNGTRGIACAATLALTQAMLWAQDEVKDVVRKGSNLQEKADKKGPTFMDEMLDFKESWHIWLLAVGLIALIGVWFYTRSQRED